MILLFLSYWEEFMLRKKSQKVIITFHTTTQAMKMESSAKKEDAPGRLIPIPREISAGCGMAWSAEVEKRGELEDLIQREQIEIQEIYEIFN